MPNIIQFINFNLTNHTKYMVIKNIHPTTLVDDITSAIEEI